MAKPVTFRPRPWLLEIFEQKVNADPSFSVTDFIHDGLEERDKLKQEVKQLRYDVEAFRSVSSPAVASSRVEPPSVSSGETVKCIPWGDMVTKAQCEECQRLKKVLSCPKIKGSVKVAVAAPPDTGGLNL